MSVIILFFSFARHPVTRMSAYLVNHYYSSLFVKKKYKNVRYRVTVAAFEFVGTRSKSTRSPAPSGQCFGKLGYIITLHVEHFSYRHDSVFDRQRHCRFVSYHIFFFKSAKPIKTRSALTEKSLSV